MVPTTITTSLYQVIHRDVLLTQIVPSLCVIISSSHSSILIQILCNHSTMVYLTRLDLTLAERILMCLIHTCNGRMKKKTIRQVLMTYHQCI